ncbi:twitchin-like isoform X1 [Stylophora pistillata]|uniref:twitchin-like isoform X1 n=1 Tax=Stylophora pistillata TaxID=50429 RepID=UPI000C042781|nr:twitchin-like isoform X1 [Stylophora pistillata]
MKTSSVLSVCSLAFLLTSVFCDLRLPKIVSSPDNPLIGKGKGNATLSWKFELRPGEAWNTSIIEVVFGVWKYPGFLKKKLLVINKTGGQKIRENYEKKISCNFDMSLLQVEFTLHDLGKSDENEYGVQVEFGLSRAPLSDSVKLHLEDPPKINSPQQRNITVKNGDPLMIRCYASGFPTPNILWKKQRKIIGNQALYFNSIKKSDSGVYLCEAHNQAGKDNAEITVRVDDSDILEFPTTQRVPESHPGVSKATSPVWIICLVTISGVLTILVLITLTKMLCRSRRCCQTEIRYKKKIGLKGSYEPFSPITEL